ncbi:MAG TPA: VOC family protein [Trebonia sp.]|jgi:catechol 2,3-dioxygenase-like lactoylglutathione lyase family enzyme
MVDFTGTGLPVIDWGEIFHVGVRVADLKQAQQELTKMTGVHWTTPATMPMNVWDPNAGSGQKAEITISFSVEGPTHIELIQGSPGSYWSADNGGAGLHHFGAWVKDVKAVNEELVGQGWVVELAGKAPEKGYGGFTYARSPAGILFEPELEAKELFERWYAGGPLY